MRSKFLYLVILSIGFHGLSLYTFGGSWENDTLKAFNYYQEALANRNSGNLDQAAKAFQRAADEYLKASQWRQSADAWLNQGRALMSQGKFKASRVAMLRAANLAQVHASEFNHKSLAAIHYHLGINSYYQNIRDSAFYHYQQALVHFQNQQPADSQRIGRTYNNIGILYSDIRDFDRTINYYQKALAIFEQQQDHNLISAIYNNIGTIYYRQHDYTKGLDYYQRSLELKLKTLGPEHRDVALAYNNIAAIYQETGDNEQAGLYYQKAYDIRLKVQGENHPETALVRRNLGIVDLETQNYLGGIERFRQCLPVWIEQVDPNHPEVATLYDHMGQGYLYLDDPEQALSLFRKAISIWKHEFGNNHPDLAMSHRKAGMALNKLNQSDYALAHFDSSLWALLPLEYDTKSLPDSLIDLASSKPELLATLNERAKILAAYGDLDHLQLADQTYGHCLAIIDKMMIEFDAEGSKLQLGQKSDRLIGEAISNKIKLFEQTSNSTYKQQAFLLAERNKSARLRESLRDLDAKQYSGVPLKLIEQEKELNLKMASLQRDLRDKLIANADSVDLAKAKDDLFTTTRLQEDLLRELEQSYPKYHQYKYQWASTESNSLDLNNLASTSTLLEYYLGVDSIYYFLVKGPNILYGQLPAPQNLESTVSALLGALKSKQFEPYAKNAHDLYLQILQPVVQRLTTDKNFTDTDHLLIVPDGLLSYVPFETLLTKPAQENDYTALDYLLKSYRISYHYSASLMAQRNPERSNNASFLGFAPEFEDEMDGLAYGERTRAYSEFMPGLPFAKDEVEGIAKLFNGVAQTGVNATESNFKKMAAKYSILHLASHSIVEDEEPLYSKLLFDNESDSLEDGELHVYELYNMQLNADLVTLSACNTGIGKLYKGEGMISLARGFLYAGVPNLVMSMWAVPDRPTKDLMTFFYEELNQGQSKDVALHQAKLRFLSQADNVTANPYYWGGFIYMGQTNESASSSKWWIWVLALALVAVGVLIWRRKKLQAS